ncbi:hypothetical protein BV97_05710 [Novosphingobium resinovorum]|uniref:Uncharacterized protein n=1 Tax=Novosphingobium resinovorum TaxID=158500 RepID=A0A031J2W7_9SPHN|nr:hypothetical protein BV97_05710 [Novosphingobium resinovorum]
MSSSVLAMVAPAIAIGERMLPPGVPGGSDSCHQPSRSCLSIERTSINSA